jgi:phosphoserine phosphatase
VIYLARHGETDWNREGRYQGQQESDLTDTGVAQAQAFAQALAAQGITRVIASPLRRCIDSSAPLANALGVTLETDRDLIEIGHGHWEGKLRAQIEREDPARWKMWREHPESVVFLGGESLRAVDLRWRAFVERLGNADNVAIVTHDVIVRIAILRATQRPLAALWEPRVLNGGYASFRGGGSWELADECVDAHLGTLIVDPAAQAL